MCEIFEIFKSERNNSQQTMTKDCFCERANPTEIQQKWKTNILSNYLETQFNETHQNHKIDFLHNDGAE